MTMGYEIRLRGEPAVSMCPFCGFDVSVRAGLVIEQRPSGDVVCEGCAPQMVRALSEELRVLREDTPTDFPDSWAALEMRLSLEVEPDPELGSLLASVALQRDPAWPTPADVNPIDVTVRSA